MCGYFCPRRARSFDDCPGVPERTGEHVRVLVARNRTEKRTEQGKPIRRARVLSSSPSPSPYSLSHQRDAAAAARRTRMDVRGSGELRAGGRGGGDGSRRTECTAERPKGRTDGTDIITRRGEADERRQRSRRKKNSSHIEPRPAASGSIGTPRFVLVVYEILEEVHHPGGLICREGRRDQTKG